MQQYTIAEGSYNLVASYGIQLATATKFRADLGIIERQGQGSHRAEDRLMPARTEVGLASAIQQFPPLLRVQDRSAQGDRFLVEVRQLQARTVAPACHFAPPLRTRPTRSEYLNSARRKIFTGFRCPRRTRLSMVRSDMPRM